MNAQRYLNVALSLAAVVVTPAVSGQIKPANAVGHTTINHRTTNRSATPFHPIL